MARRFDPAVAAEQTVQAFKAALGNDLSGRNVVVIGRSILVGKPSAMLFLAENCTVTIAHSRTRDLPALCRTADILVAAVGRADTSRPVARPRASYFCTSASGPCPTIPGRRARSTSTLRRPTNAA